MTVELLFFLPHRSRSPVGGRTNTTVKHITMYYYVQMQGENTEKSLCGRFGGELTGQGTYIAGVLK